MTKEEIREGIAKQLAQFNGHDWSRLSKEAQGTYRGRAIVMVSLLHSKGVIVKVKCPDCEWSHFKDEAVGMTPCYHCNSTGYLVEDLI